MINKTKEKRKNLESFKLIFKDGDSRRIYRKTKTYKRNVNCNWKRGLIIRRDSLVM